jgi:hypothetical protein
VLALLACFSLMIGLATYLLVRDLRSLHLNTLFTLPGHALSLTDLVPRPVLMAFGSIPTAIHVFAFSLLTALALGEKRSTPLLACVSWVLIGVGFELLQYPEDCPEFFRYGNEVLRGNLCAYVAAGVFDWWDVGANLAGTAVAYLLLRRFSNKSWR